MLLSFMVQTKTHQNDKERIGIGILIYHVRCKLGHGVYVNVTKTGFKEKDKLNWKVMVK